MGKLAQICEDLAEGTRVGKAWGSLVGKPAAGLNSVLLSECPRLIQSDKIDELELCYNLLATVEAAENASSVHLSEFGLNSGVAKLEIMRQVVGCAGLAAVSKTPCSQSNSSDIEKWAPRAMGLVPQVTAKLEIHGVETTATLIKQALDAVEDDKDEKRQFAHAMTCWFSGIDRKVEHRLTVPVLLYDQSTGEGIVGEVRFTRMPGSSGACYPSPHTKLHVEVDGETRAGIDLAWKRAQKLHPGTCDAQWDLSGINTISGRSAEAAFSLGFQLLLQGAPYDTRCMITAAVEDEGSLIQVSGVNDPGNPKLHAAKSRVNNQSEVTVIVSTANRLSAPEEQAWKDNGVSVVSCENLDEACQIVSRQLQQIDAMLNSQVDLICQQAAKRFDREILNAQVLQGYCVPIRLARGVRSETEDDEIEQDVEAPIVEEFEPEDDEEQVREVVQWDDFVADFDGRAIALGDPGFGKTTLLWNLVANRCQNAIEQLGHGAAIDDVDFAFFLPASKLEDCDSAKATESLIQVLAQQYDIAPALFGWLEEKVSKGKCVLCFDAYDEATDERRVDEFFVEFLKANPKAQVILTSRLTGFGRSPIEVEGEDLLELLPFDHEQMRLVVGTWFPEDAAQAAEVWTLLSKDKRLQDVLRSPILLNLARQQITDRLNRGKPLPNWRRRSELYTGFVSLSLENLRNRTNQPLTEMEQEEFPILLEELALHVWLDDPRQTIVPRSKVREILKIVAKDLWGMKDRFPTLLNDLQDSGLLVPVALNDDTSSMMFLHRTIGEFLAGRCLANRIERGDADAWDIIEKKSWSPDWKQVVLFCASCLKDANPLLDRLKEPDPTETNPHGDDVLRHRLLLAAQCLPELGSIEPAQLHSISDQVVSEFRQVSSLDEAVAAIRSLFIVDAKFEGKPVAFRFATHSSSARVLDSSGYSDDLFEHFRDLLWDACKPDESRGRMTRRNPSPFAASLLAIVDSLDIDRVCIPGEAEEGHYWRVVGAIFREASIQKSKTIELNVEFLRRLGSYLFRFGTGSNVGLRQFIEYLPPVSKELLEESSILVEAAKVLTDQGKRAIHKDVFALLESLGGNAGQFEVVSSALLNLDSGSGSREKRNAVASLAHSLVANGFVPRLCNSIKNSNDRSSKRDGTELLLSLYSANTQEWRDAVVNFAEEDGPLTSQVLTRTLRRNMKPEFLELVFQLLDKASTHNVGIQCIGKFVEQISGPRASDLSTSLNFLDRIANKLHAPKGKTSFEIPEFLEDLLNSSEIGLRGLVASFVDLSLKHRANNALLNWLAGKVIAEDGSGEFSRILAARFNELSQRLQEYVRERISDAIIDSGEAPLLLRLLGQTDPEKLVLKIKESQSVDRLKLRYVSLLPVAAVCDSEVASLVINNLNATQREKRELATMSLAKISPDVLSNHLCEAIIRKIEGRDRSLVKSVSLLVKRAPDKFEKPIVDAFEDLDNPGRDTVASLLPILGDRLVENGFAKQLADQVVNGEKKERLTALRCLSQAIVFASDNMRLEVFKVSAEAYQEVMANRQTGGTQTSHQIIFASLLSPFSDHLSIVPWLVERLASDNEATARFAYRLLVDREPTRLMRERKLSTLNWRRFLSSYRATLPRFVINQRLNCGLLARLAENQFRVFSTVNDATAFPISELSQ